MLPTKKNFQIKSKLLRLVVILFAYTLPALIKNPLVSNAQIASHELRRLALSTNQFGIDALRALDRVEPHHKVLVFCPVCLTSSLVMVMMGSSKYHVVSSLRQALYVWSMKPNEINRGFRDIFEHIGLNQQSQPFTQIKTTGSRLNSTTPLSRSSQEDIHSGDYDLDRVFDLGELTSNRHMSLPDLIRLREKMNRKWHNNNLKQSGKDESHHSKASKKTSSTGSKNRMGSQESCDAGQISSMSDIYIQRGLSMDYHYNLLLREFYKTVVRPVDFIRNGEETRQHINSLVASSTEGKIKDLVKMETLKLTVNKNPRVMIISAFHFRGTLDIQLRANGGGGKNDQVPTNDTLQRTRTSKAIESKNAINFESSGRQTNVSRPLRDASFIETEESLLKYGEFPNLNCKAIEIPFNNRLVSLVIVMSNSRNSTELLMSKLSAQVLNDIISSLTVKKVSLAIPVIKFDRGPTNVEGLLRELELGNLFFGEKLHSSETGLNRWLRPADIVHETSIDIGTINPKWSQPEDRLKAGAHDVRHLAGNRDDRRLKINDTINATSHLSLDKTFMYFVLDSINGLILTMGRVRQ